jgi:hypothetical protein
LMSFSGQLPLKDYSFPQMDGVMRSSFAIRWTRALYIW